MATATSVSTFSGTDSSTNPVLVPVLPEFYKTASVQITAPASASAYTQGNIITSTSPAAFTFVAARVASGFFALKYIDLDMTGTDTAFLNQPVTMKIYSSTPAFNSGDRTAWAINTTQTGFVGEMQGVLNQQFGASAAQTALKCLMVPTLSDELLVGCDASKQFYGVLVAGATFTPANATHVFNAVAGGRAL
jgi:hypothetical protein